MRTILLIDDEIDFCFFVKENLEATQKFQVVTATTGLEGLKMAFQHRPDVILLDIAMPGMSGDEVADKLKQSTETSSIPIIFLTALVSKTETGPNNFQEIGNRFFISKPVSTDVLLAHLNTLLTQS